MLLASGIIKKFWTSMTQTQTTVVPVGNAPLAHHGLSSVMPLNSAVENVEVAQMAAHAVNAIISGEASSVQQIGKLASSAVQWLKESLPIAHQDKALKQKIKSLFGVIRFTTNLAYFELWDDLIRDCGSMALELGREMQKYFVAKDLGTVLGEAIPNVFATVHISESASGNIFVTTPCSKEDGVRRQDGIMPSSNAESGVPGWRMNPDFSQLWNEKGFIHCLRMVAMGINHRFQKAVEKICIRSKGEFKQTAIKGYGRMSNKMISKDDHYYEAYPRPSLNIDINRNCCCFEKHKALQSFVDDMKKHPMFGGHPVRVKNMFLFDEEQAEKQFHYRTVMINWLYTPGITYKELAEESNDLWQQYLNYVTVDGHGDKDPSESWSTWRAQIQEAFSYLTSQAISNKKVQFIVETQLLLRPYLLGRQKMHLLYKVCRAENPTQLSRDFLVQNDPETRSFEEVQADALNEMKSFLAETNNVNFQSRDIGGATQLWKAAEQGHELAVREILQHPKTDPNVPHSETKTTPLCVAAFYGHVEVVREILRHPAVRVNDGQIRQKRSSLFMAAQGGREGVVRELLGAKGVDINHADTEGVTAIRIAGSQGHEHVVALLHAASGISSSCAEIE